MMRLVRSSLADHIVYQSHFVENVWNAAHGAAKVPSTIIHNAVDLTRFCPHGPRYQSWADICVISVEGSQGLDPFDIAIELARQLEETGLTTELLVFGKPWGDAETRFTRFPFAQFMGPVSNAELPYYYRGSAVYVLTDMLDAGCPNSVLEALACGTPVLGYAVGVLPELLAGSAGRCICYCGDPWKGEPPGNREGMATAALELLCEFNRFRDGARRLAEERYGLERMVDGYVRVLSDSRGRDE
jgi:glycosyltransferase involved in cell wall biosynthesis